jgi:excisionase family DNA binding protein
MSSFIEIDGKKFQSVSDAARLTGYSRDYIGRLAREQKILATQVGRQWFVSVVSLQEYAKTAEREQKLRQQKLSLERKLERETTRRVEEKKRKVQIEKQRKTFRAKASAIVVLALGVTLGVVLNSTSLATLGSKKQIASAPQAEVFPPATGEFEVATGKTIEQVRFDSIDFSQESVSIATLDGDGVGVMLLPQGSDKTLTEAEMKNLFSDPIHLVKDEGGNQYVVRKTQDGREERLPFVVVPVTNSVTP